MTDLPATGWTLLRPGHGWELVFKCGVPCPPHLPPHVHSDQLSVELSYQGKWLLSEAGTSIYGDGPERAFERSGAAHNVLQLGLSLPSGEIEWIEPVEVWGGFRAARKAQPRHRQSGVLSDALCFAAGSHDGFDRFGASHERRVELSNANPQKVVLTVEDAVSTRRPLHFRQWWHLAPGIRKTWLIRRCLRLRQRKRSSPTGTQPGFQKASGNAPHGRASASVAVCPRELTNFASPFHFLLLLCNPHCYAPPLADQSVRQYPRFAWAYPSI